MSIGFLPHNWASGPRTKGKTLGDKSSLSLGLVFPTLSHLACSPVTQQLTGLPYSGSGLGLYCQVDLQTWDVIEKLWLELGFFQMLSKLCTTELCLLAPKRARARTLTHPYQFPSFSPLNSILNPERPPVSQLPYSATTGCEEPTNWRFLRWTPNAWILLGRLLVAGKGCEIFIHPRLHRFSKLVLIWFGMGRWEPL